MKITLAVYPFLKGLADTQKRPSVRVPDAVPNRTDTLSLSAVPDKALVKYLQAIDDMASELIQMADDYAATEAAPAVETGPAAVETRPAAAPAIVVYFPPSGQGDATVPDKGQLIVMNKEGLVPGTESPVPQTDNDFLALSGDVSRELSPLMSGLGIPAGRFDLSLVSAKLIAVLDVEDDVPVIQVMRQDETGHLEPVPPDSDSHSLVLNIVERISADLGGPEKTLKRTVDESGAPGAAAPALRDPVETIRRAFSAIQARFTGAVSTGATAVTAQGRDVPKDNGAAAAEIPGGPGPARGFIPGNARPGTAAGTVVHYLDVPRGPVSHVEAPGTVIAARITEKMASLATQLEEAPYFPVEGAGLPEEDPALLEKVSAAVRENTAGLIKRVLHTAVSQVRSEYPGLDTEALGVRLDENGFFKIDRTALSESLSSKKDETAMFVRELGNSLQDRIRYDFNPVAGLFAGRGTEDGILETGKKRGTADEGDDRPRVQLEKRLNEVQMLLRSSYELKELFLKGGSAGQPGFLDETDR